MPLPQARAEMRTQRQHVIPGLFGASRAHDARSVVAGAVRAFPRSPVAQVPKPALRIELPQGGTGSLLSRGEGVFPKPIHPRQNHVVGFGASFLGHHARLKALRVAVAGEGQLRQPPHLCQRSCGDDFQHSSVRIWAVLQDLGTANDIHPRHALFREENPMSFSPRLAFDAGIQKQCGHAQPRQSAQHRSQHARTG